MKPEKSFIELVTANASKQTKQEIGRMTSSRVRKGSSAGIKRAARKFLNTLMSYNSLQSGLSSVIKYTVPRTPESANQLFNTLKNNLILGLKTKELIQDIWEFQVQLNSFLDREIFLTVVDTEGNLWIYSSADELDIMFEGYKSNSSSEKKRTRLNFSNSADSLFREAQKIDTSMLQRMAKKVNKGIGNLLNTYNLSTERFKLKKNENQAGFIYYHNNESKRTPLYVSGLGIVGEAYVAALFNDQESDDHFSNSYHNEPGILYFYQKYCLNTDNRSGTVLGDIAKNDDILAKIQLAVKTKGAATESFAPLIDTAQYILTCKERVTADTLADYWLEKENNGSLLYRNSKQLTQNAIDNALKRIEESIKDF